MEGIHMNGKVNNVVSSAIKLIFQTSLPINRCNIEKGGYLTTQAKLTSI